MIDTHASDHYLRYLIAALDVRREAIVGASPHERVGEKPRVMVITASPRPDSAEHLGALRGR
jgi:hypothetical protein